MLSYNPTQINTDLAGLVINTGLKLLDYDNLYSCLKGADNKFGRSPLSKNYLKVVMHGVYSRNTSDLHAAGLTLHQVLLFVDQMNAAMTKSSSKEELEGAIERELREGSPAGWSAYFQRLSADEASWNVQSSTD